MKIIQSPAEAYSHVSHWQRAGLRIGLIPTMGALHAGHLSLVERSVQDCDISVATIFVNPTQFAPQEDLSRYPRTLDSDLQLLSDARCDAVFVPNAAAIYPAGFSTHIQPPAVAGPLEGEFRPIHFGGVCTVVLKLFHILPATIAYFGQKDYQQLLVVRRMTEDLNVPIRIEGCPIVREADGLAMSSRNRYLTPAQRQAALCLWQALQLVQQRAAEGCRAVIELESAMQEYLLAHGALCVDYARIVDPETLQSLTRLDQPAIALIAAHVGTTRLIDNLLLRF